MQTAHEIAGAIHSRPWAMPRDRLHALAAAAASGSFGSRAPRATPQQTGRVCVIPVHGVLTQRPSLFSMLGLGTSTRAISTQVQLALLDDSIAAIVLDIDSSGGESYGVTELASELLAARRSKPIAAIANSMAASAAYWLAASCTEIYVTPGGEVGGIGVYNVHQDVSKALEQAGINVTLISAGKYKTEGHPYGPLEADTQGFMQKRVDECAAMFVKDVARGRNVSESTVRDTFGQGRVLGAKQAKAAKMVDGICTLDQLVSDLARGKSSGGGAGASARLLFNVALAENT